MPTWQDYLTVSPPGPYHGQALPKVSGFKKLPPGYGPMTNAYDGGFAGTMAFYPLVITDLQPILSVSIKGGGAGDSGDKGRIILADNDGSFTVLKDWGEYTLTGSLAVQTLTSTYTPTKTGVHWLCLHLKDSSAYINMQPSISATAVGGAIGLNMFNVLGEYTVGTNQGNQPYCMTKTVAYAAPGATLAAPDGIYYGTSTLFTKDTAAGGGYPAIWLG